MHIYNLPDCRLELERFFCRPACSPVRQGLAAQSMQFAFKNRDNQSDFQSVKSVEMFRKGVEEGWRRQPTQCELRNFKSILFVDSCSS